MKWLLVVFTLLSIGITSLQAERKIIIENAFYGADMDKVSYNSAKLALNLWIKQIAKKTPGVSSRMLFYTDFNRLKKDTQEGKMDALIISSYSYVMHSDFYKKYFHEGWIRTEKDQKPFLSYVIIKRKGTQIKNNSTVHYYKYSKISKIIIEKYAINHNLDLEYVSTKKKSKPVLDLFFKKCDIAIVSEFSWELMQELNPQLNQSLVVVYKTDRIFTPVFSLFSKKINNRKKKLYLKGLKDIRNTEDGQQFMQMLKFNTLIKFDNSKLSEVEKFYKNYLILKKEYGK